MRVALGLLICVIIAWGYYESNTDEYHLDIYRINEGYSIQFDDTVNEGDSMHFIFTTGYNLPPYQSPYTRHLWKTEIFPNTEEMWDDSIGHVYFEVDYPAGSYELILNAVALSDTDTMIAVGTNAVYLYVDTSDVSLMIGLSFFEAVLIDNKVSLSWITESELNNCGFNIYKKEYRGIESIMNEHLIPGERNSSSRTTYGLIDSNVKPGKSYIYTLESVSCSGEHEIEGKVRIYVPMVSGIYLSDNYPNPFNGTTTIEYSIDERAEISLSIYDVRGRVAHVFKEIQSAGMYSKKISANGMASGTYMYFLRVHNTRTMTVQILSKKMTVIK